ncbi:hypothetical protein [Croceimicrobium sp.]|uniref:hypothetical protein n=1 Tax=Croceimicrobium sp. TaxID=2828340 RepID=UPI003BAD39FD
MSEFIKQKQIQNLTTDLAAKALDSQVVKKANNLSDVNAASARTNLEVYSKTEVQNMISGADNGFNVATIADRDALTGLNVSDRVFVSNDGDEKWGMYIVTGVTDGNGSTSTFEKVADEDAFSNALTKEAIKSSYESNANTNAFTDAEKTKIGHISVTQAVNLDNIESGLASTTTTANNALSTANSASTAATNAQNTANSASTAAANAQTAADEAQFDANAAQSTANSALNTANSKQDIFNETREDFTGRNGEAGVPVSLTLENEVAAGFEPLVYFNGLLVKTVTYSPGSPEISYTVPYVTETSDTVSVAYAYR